MSRLRVKFCGIRTPADAAIAGRLGADAVGMILHADAKRLIDTDVAAEIVLSLPPYVTPVAVVIDASKIVMDRIADATGIRTFQLHGAETPADVDALAGYAVIKAIRVDPATIRTTLQIWRDALDAGRCCNLTGLLLDTAAHGAAGGTGRANDFDLIARLQAEGACEGLPPMILAGGLTPETVGPVAALRPYAVDVSSGIESSFGVKSEAKMRAFLAAVAAA